MSFDTHQAGGWLRANMMRADVARAALGRSMHAMVRRLGTSGRAAAIGCIGVLLSLVAAFGVGRWQSSLAHAEFEGAARIQATILQNGVNEYLNRLVALKTLFESSNRTVTRSEFEVFISRLFEDRPGLFRVSWIPRVKHDERAEYERAAVADGIAGYHIRSLSAEGKTVPAPEGDEYYPVYYSTEPKTAAIYGFNVASDPIRRAVTERARDNDAIATLSAHRRYVQAGNPNGIGVSVPVYAKGTSREHVADRRQNLIGFVSGIFELTRLINTVMTNAGATSDVVLFVHAPGGSVLAKSAGTIPSPGSWLHGRLIDLIGSQPSWSGTLKIGDETWVLSSRPSADSRLATRLDRALLVLIAGLVMTALLVAYIGFTRRHRRTVQLALTDALTGLANRRAFFEQLEAVLQDRRGGGGANGFAVLYFDLDRFKQVNDQLGHTAGDELLCHVASRLRRTLRDGELGARFGGDEFAVLLRDVADDAAVEALAHRIGEAIAEPYRINDAVAQVTASIGIARSLPGLADAETMLMRADRALYRAKEDGRNRFCLYSDELDRQLRERVQLGKELRNAISRGELELHYQPQVELATGRILGLEALLRWRHATRGLLAPADFLPIAERNGSILEIGRWVFDTACRQYRAWDDAGIAPRVLAVNLSIGQLLATDDIESEMAASLRQWRIGADTIELEIPQDALGATGEVDDRLRKLRQAGLRLALSEFGSGSCSLSQLATARVHRLKIARAIVAGVATDPTNAIVARTAIRLANELAIKVVAEGVETLAQANCLAALGCKQAQGFHFGQPLGAALTTELLRQRTVGAKAPSPPKVATAA